ncbi:MAG: flagellar biosynthesis protein FlhB [Nitrospira sp.]|nr:flagellar biosynthesis protein FlhB [Nitrospira sp.]MDH4302508.1 flagellar biosynthesis protein FlhB [Nitrospira sp.]MDH5192352.1 flagellar biosynthesis protein FlhB [Nitrospira sp.]
MAEDRDNKTEPATPKRKEEARKQGQVAVSRDVSTAAVLLGGVGLLGSMLPVGLLKMTEMTRQGLTLPYPGAWYREISIDQVYTILIQTGVTVGVLSLPIVAGVLVLGTVATLLQTGLLWRTTAFKLDWSRINPAKGFSRLASLRSVVELIKGLLKIAIITGVGLWASRHDVLHIPELIQFELSGVLPLAGSLAFKIGLAVSGAIALVAVLDYAYQRYEWERSLRMSKQEIKEEQKAAEGDPLIKGRVRTVQRELVKKRMLAAVKTADVVITNPTHLAVALKYDTATMAAPVVVAKGAGVIAERIRELARHHNVPVVENKFVARTVFKLVEVGKEIPHDLYRAVAEILAYVYRARGITA